MNNLLLFTNNLRINDNPALYNAAISGLPVIGIYIDDPSEKLGKNARIWLYQSLLSLKTSLKKRYNFDLYIIKGDKIQILEKLVSKNNIRNLYIDSYKEDYLRKSNILQKINIFRYNSSCLINYDYQSFIKNRQSFQVFFNHSITRNIRNILGKPTHIICQHLQSDNSLDIVSDISKISIPFWSVGEQTALTKFLSFRIKDYEKTRNRLDYDSTSYLSPHLRFGEISAAYIYHQLKNLVHHFDVSNDINQFIKQLLLRDFVIYSYNFNLNSQIKNLNILGRNKDFISKWQQGKTGYKIIDAAMQQLLKTGWMHNRARMITSSFLIKNLHQDYYYGQKWFFDNLYDADIAINHLSWQWAVGISSDAIPSFRIFNPELQANRFDPKRQYINKWQCKQSPSDYIINFNDSSKKWINYATTT